MNLRQKVNENMPYVADVEKMSARNGFFRVAIWTGKYAQMTLMSIPVLGDVGLEVHEDTDQIIRVEHGIAMLQLGKDSDNPEALQMVSKGDVIFIPAGTYHNIINKGRRVLKLSSIYAPPYHPANTIHRTKKDAENAHDVQSNEVNSEEIS